MIHALKTWSEYFAACKDGRKTFEIRKYDRPFVIGDWLELHEWNPDTQTFGNEKPIMFEITYIMRLPSCFVGEPDHCCMAIKPIDAKGETE